ncbi:hypothetical protein [Streptomyces sp. NPDC059943]|uniref:hypothetical protein n=1 Tax=Streptomyces sp. NPDC059943 TaxID=3347010 RepID=UPI00365F3950
MRAALAATSPGHSQTFPLFVLEDPVVGDALGVIRRQVHDDLRRFKEYIEAQGRENGQWRGTISGSHVNPDSDHPPPQVPNWPSG